MADIRPEVSERVFTIRAVSTQTGSDGRWEVRRAVESLAAVRRGAQRPLEDLARVRHAHEALSRATNLLVDAARAEGATWEQIGTALGITRQAARQAKARREHLEEIRAEAKQWNVPLPQHQPRFRWLPRPRLLTRRSAA